MFFFFLQFIQLWQRNFCFHVCFCYSSYKSIKNISTITNKQNKWIEIYEPPPPPLYFIELALKAFNIKSINRSIHDDDDDLMGNYLFIFCFVFVILSFYKSTHHVNLPVWYFFFLQNSGFSPLTNESILPCMCILCYSDDDDDGCIRNGCG